MTNELLTIATQLRDHAEDLERCATQFEQSHLSKAFTQTVAEFRKAALENQARADRLEIIGTAYQKVVGEMRTHLDRDGCACCRTEDWCQGMEKAP